MRPKKSAIVVHSGGMDSSLCLAHAIKTYGKDRVLSISFRYGQRHSLELERAAEMCKTWGVDHTVLDIDCLSHITTNALTSHGMDIQHQEGQAPNTMVVGRNGLMARIAAIHAHDLGASRIYMGVIEVESANSGYRDCSRAYMDKMQDILRMDFDNPDFEIATPISHMTKYETMEFGYGLGVLEYLLDKTITCYEGIPHAGCKVCPACLLRNDGLRQFIERHPNFPSPFEPPGLASKSQET